MYLLEIEDLYADYCILQVLPYDNLAYSYDDFLSSDAALYVDR